jgi:O-antigen ligase
VTERAKRPSIWLLAGLVLVFSLWAGALWAWMRWAAPQPGVDDSSPTYAPLAGDKSLGVNADLSNYDDARREQALAAMQAAGFRWLRQRFPWDAIEPEPGAYDWTVWDEVVQGAARHNLELIAVLDGSPAWARAAEDADNRLAPPIETRDFGAFAAAVAMRYGNWIDDYEIWDEPNIAPHWGAREIDPAAYARLLREGAIQLRAVDPGAVVLLAALAPNVEPGGANMSDLLFLDGLYRWGADEWFDVLAVQPYDFGQPLALSPDPGQLNWSRAGLLREEMEAHGDGQTPAWAVSFARTAATPETVLESVKQAREDWPWLGPMLWAAWSPADAHGDYALMDEQMQRQASYYALQELATAPPIAWPGVYPADDPSGYYEGGWQVTPSGADIGASGDHLTIAFHGTRLDLAVRRGDYRAFLFVTVDGQPANALPVDSDGRAYVVLYDPLRQEANVTLARALPDGDHVAEVIAERGWGQWAIAGWTVSRETPGRFPWLPTALGLAGVAVLGITIQHSWPQRYPLLAAGRSLLVHYRTLDDRLALVLVAAAAILVYVIIGTIPSLAALGLLAGLLLVRPELGLPLIAVTLPFYQPGKALLGKVFSMVEILTLLTAMGWVVNWGVRELRTRQITELEKREGTSNISRYASRIKSTVSRRTALDWGVLALVTVGAMSLLWSEHLREAAREFRTVVLEAAIFYGLLRAMAHERRDIWRVADAWVLGGAIIAVVGVGQWAFGQNLITADGVWRVRGFYGSPNNLALYLGRVLPLCVAIFLFGTSASQEAGTAAKRRRWLYGLASVVLAVAVLLTYSRGAWLLGVPASLLFLAAMRGRRALAITVGLLVIAAVVVAVIVGSGRLTSLLDTGEGTTFFRLQLWQSSWAMVRDHPLLGVGLDNFLYYYRTRYVLPTAWEEFNLSHPHNLVLDFWLRLGLMGLVVLGWLLVAFFRQGGRLYRRLQEGGERWLVLGLMAGMVNFLAHGLVDNAFFLVDLAFVFMLMLALVQAICDQPANPTTLRITNTR